eukprot:scaffold33550_cov28-Attheya_sp.AAC.3
MCLPLSVGALATWPADDRAEVMPILNWLWLACMKRGRSAAATASQTSTLAMDWTVILANREYIRWSKKHHNGLLGVAQSVQMSPAAQPADASGMFMTPQGNNANPLNAREMQDSFFERLAITFVNVHHQNLTPPTATTRGKGTTTKGFSPTEKIRMLGWRGLGKSADLSEIPEIWTEIHAESSKNAILVTAFDPVTTDNHDIDIHVDQKLTDDVVSYNFGYGIGCDYLLCHDGISPFAVAVYSRREKSELDMTDHNATRTFADVKSTRRAPPKCPSTVDALLQWMKNYTCFLNTLFGPKCPHLRQVQKLVTVLQANKRMMNSNSGGRDMIAQILWAIFGDARQFFGKCAKEKDLENLDDMPLSHLQAVHSILASSKLELRLMDVPHEPLAKKPPAPAPRGPPVQQGGNPSKGRQTPRRVEHTPDTSQRDHI